jgi:type III pantothenate kinase
MLLAINIGNSSTSFGVHAEGGWKDRRRLRTDPSRTADEHAVFFRSLLAASGTDPAAIKRTVIASVVPQLTGAVSVMVKELTGGMPLLVGPGIKTGIRIRTDNPAEVGADLVANAVAGYERARSSCIIVDFGTALTFTAVAAPGDLVGVAISPGLAYATEALSDHTAQLPMVKLEAPATAIGKNTVHSIQSGVVFGYGGLVDALIDRITSELPAPVRVIATGGQFTVIAPLTSRFSETDTWLTLDGLRLIAERNA